MLLIGSSSGGKTAGSTQTYLLQPGCHHLRGLPVTTLEKIRKLERYFYHSGQDAEPVIDKAIDKLIRREKKRVQELQDKIGRQLKEFENKYGKSTEIFRRRFQQGKLGDSIYYIEWDATQEMYLNVNNNITLLNEEINSK